jgi:hypothetical protein
MRPLCHALAPPALHGLAKLAHPLTGRADGGAQRKIRAHFANRCGGGGPGMSYRGDRLMRPELIFYTEGFAAGNELPALASRRADALLRQVPGIARIRLVVIFETLPNGTGVFAARGRVEGPQGATAVTEVAHDPDAAIQRAFLRLSRRLTGRAGGGPGGRR